MKSDVRSWGLALLLAVLAAVAACGGDSEPADSGVGAPPNEFLNPGFEEGEEPWFSLETPAWGAAFRTSEAVAHSGRRSAYLEMRAPPQVAGTSVYGVVQEVAPEEFPEVVSGYYRVENWTRGTPKQYLQFVVIAWGVDNLPGGFPNHQIRYPLAGIGEPPFTITNAKFVFIGTEEPVSGEWVYFERNLRRDFEEAWGAVPEGFDKIRFLFEVRYDEKEAGFGDVRADVYYDDLYVGPADGNPDRQP